MFWAENLPGYELLAGLGTPPGWEWQMSPFWSTEWFIALTLEPCLHSWGGIQHSGQAGCGSSVLGCRLWGASSWTWSTAPCRAMRGSWALRGTAPHTEAVGAAVSLVLPGREGSRSPGRSEAFLLSLCVEMVISVVAVQRVLSDGGGSGGGHGPAPVCGAGRRGLELLLCAGRRRLSSGVWGCVGMWLWFVGITDVVCPAFLELASVRSSVAWSVLWAVLWCPLWMTLLSVPVLGCSMGWQSAEWPVRPGWAGEVMVPSGLQVQNAMERSAAGVWC